MNWIKMFTLKPKHYVYMMSSMRTGKNSILVFRSWYFEQKLLCIMQDIYRRTLLLKFGFNETKIQTSPQIFLCKRISLSICLHLVPKACVSFKNNAFIFYWCNIFYHGTKLNRKLYLILLRNNCGRRSRKIIWHGIMRKTW